MKLHFIFITLYLICIQYFISISATPQQPQRIVHNITTSRLGNLANHAPSSITVEAPKGPDTEDKLIFHQNEHGEATIALTPKQFCDICHATVDTGISLLRRGVTLNSHEDEKRDELIKKFGIQFVSKAEYDNNGKLSWSSDDMADEICEKAMGHFKPQYTLGCHHIIADHHEKIFKPFDDVKTFDNLMNDTIILDHKLDFCFYNGICVAGQGLVDEQKPCVENTPIQRSKCESCLELAHDSQMVFKRLMTTIPNPENNAKLRERCTMTKGNFEGFKSVWCDSLSLRHFRSEALKDVCTSIINNDETSNNLFNVVKDGNMLHRLLKNSTTWEHTLCMKVTSHCTEDEYNDLYAIWDEAADYDYNITQSRYVLDQHLKGHQRSLEELEEEYFYTPKYMYAPHPDSLSEDEKLSYKEYIKNAKKLNDIQNKDEEFNLDDGNDENDHIHGITIDKNDKSNNNDKNDDNDDNNLTSEEDTELSPELSKRLLGRLSYIDEQGVRVPNELPPHVLREYKAKRHQLIHSVKHQSTVKELQGKLDEIKALGPKYEGKRRVWALPDKMLISNRMATILTRLLNLKEARAKGIQTEALIQETYDTQVREMTEFSKGFNQTELNKYYDLDLDDDDVILANSYQDPEIQNEVENEKGNNKDNGKKNNMKDEL